MGQTWAETIRDLIARAEERCEYCRMHQSLQGATFHVEHIIPRAVGGNNEPMNLCLACPSCNLHKSSRTTATDPETNDLVTLFHPRQHHWHDHFTWDGFFIRGLSGIGRATIAALNLNAER
jgi:5-methylcytosine-specific restriction endonuclease McrA